MKFFALLLCVAFIAAAPAAVSGKNVQNNEQQMKSSSSMPAVKPTAAPLMTSTAAPTKSPKVTAAPTKAPAAIKATVKPNNGNKKKMDVKPTEKTPMAGDMMKMVVKPMDMPVTVVPEKSGEAKEAKPLAVTGFITQNGNIYEIDDKEIGIGKIEGRQNAHDDGKEHICNYGSVVVYSDLPCEDVVSTENVLPSPMKDDKKDEMKPQEESAVGDSQNKDDDMDKDKEDMDDIKPARRPNSKKPRNKNKNMRQQQKNRRNKNRRGNRPLRRQGQNQRRSQQELEWNQRRRRQQQKRRRAQLEEQEFRRQNQRRRNKGGNRGGNRRQPAYVDDYDDEDDY